MIFFRYYLCLVLSLAYLDMVPFLEVFDQVDWLKRHGLRDLLHLWQHGDLLPDRVDHRADEITQIAMAHAHHISLLKLVLRVQQQTHLSRRAVHHLLPFLLVWLAFEEVI